jgi:hypothetical protein
VAEDPPKIPDSSPEDPLEPLKPPAEDPAPPPVAVVRATVARWPIPWREAWGRRANHYLDQGQPHPGDERLAYHDCAREMRKRGLDPETLTRDDGPARPVVKGDLRPLPPDVDPEGPLPPSELVTEIVVSWPKPWQVLWERKADDYVLRGVPRPEDEVRACLDVFAVMQEQPGIPWKEVA